jgi:ABC-type transport system involved in Fe-S cluster assembly fused permease/ATPase subunit
MVKEQRIQKIIQNSFKESTLVIISDRVKTILDSDKILILEDGKLTEYDQQSVATKEPLSGLSKTLKKIKTRDKVPHKEKIDHLSSHNETVVEAPINVKEDDTSKKIETLQAIIIRVMSKIEVT